MVNAGGEYLQLNGEEFKSFSNKRLANTDESYIDLLAKNFLYENSFELPVKLLATQYRTKKSFLREFTGLHMIVITLRCNQKCRYCQVSSEYADATKYDMPVETARKCVNLIFQSPSPYIKIEFQGGEPLLNFDVIEYVVEYAKELNLKSEKNLEFVICTNLISITDSQLAFCQEHDIFLSTSLDGPADIHDFNRPSEAGKGTYSQVVESIKNAREVLGRDKVAALMTATKASLGRFPEIVDEYLSMGFSEIFFRSLNPYGMAEKRKDILGYNMEEFVESYFEGLEYVIETNLAGHYFVEEYARLLLTRILTPFTTGFVDLQSPTGAGIGGVIYDYDGRVYVADEGRMLARKGDTKFLMGTVDDSYISIFGGETVRAVVGASCVECLPQCIDCAFQLWCGADPVRNYTTQGDLIGYRPTNEFCEKNMKVIKFLVKLVETADEKVKSVLWSWLSGISLESQETFG